MRPMKNLLKFVLIGFMATLLSGTAAVADQTGYAKQKVVYHINYDNQKPTQEHLEIFKTTLMPSALKIWI